MKAVRCPGCRLPMQPVALDRHLHGTLTVDVCAGCHALWFDATESLQLSPAGTLQLFRTISDAGPVHGDRTGSPLPCPRCDTPLTHTQDLQHTTRFAYYRCRHGHGRYTPYVQFLREKNFIRQVSPADLERLKKLVRIVRCSSCGAPIDLERQTACGYCRAPIAILDQEAVARTLRELDHAAARRAEIASPERAAAAILETARFERAMTAERATERGTSGVDLVAIGLSLLASLASR